MKKLSVIGVMALMIFSACKKEDQKKPVDSTVESFKELKVPSNFDFKTFRDVQMNVSVENPGFENPFQIKVYDYLPSAGGSVIYSGFTSGDELSANITIPQALQKVYLVKVDPNGASTQTAVELNGSALNFTFDKGKKDKKTLVISPDCSSGCNTTLSLSSLQGSPYWGNATGGGVYCVTGSYSGSGITVKDGSTLRLCGTGSFGYITIDNGTVEIADGADVAVGNFNMNGSPNVHSLTIYPEGALTVTGSFTTNHNMTNHGTLNANQLIVKRDFTNNGTVNITDANAYSKVESQGEIVNNGSFIVEGFYEVDADFTNNCFMNVKKELKILSGDRLTNYEYVKVGQNFTINSNGDLDMHDGAMVSVDGAMPWTLNGRMTGYGTTSLVKIDGVVNSNSGSRVQGNLELCVGGSTNFASGTLVAPAVTACDQVYIPTSACNSEGNGTPSVVDTDNDGVADENDLFPNDGNKAGEVYYPGSNTFGTLAFEDLWPSQGDYDFNDVVVDYRYRAITNAAGNVVEMELDYVLKAIGGSLKNGFGIQYDQLSSSDVSSISRTGDFVSNNLNGNGTESGQSNAVIIFFENAFEVLPNLGTPTVNTDPSRPHSEEDTNRVVVVFNSPKSQAAALDINPFIYIGQERGKEVHLPGYQPTDRVEANYFGQNDDDSDPSQGRYYVNESNLPWALNVAQKWEYPVEKQDIVQAYLKFADWAQSGGSSFTDWYVQPSYVDDNLIY